MNLPEGLAQTPKPPYYAVIFTTTARNLDDDYEKVAQRMEELAAEQDGFLGIESCRSDVGITISYWRDEDAIKAWKHQSEHAVARDLGREKWYDSYFLRVAKVERAYSFMSSTNGEQ